ncbi:hypothetical protein BaRGS_00027810 [Batillaria attramentaria]|uniref:Uncharacterized protein n=1 Tax=Batillaria attramentaria TaxID=370345 RepID=A0ABD0K0U7_9CAEN
MSLILPPIAEYINILSTQCNTTVRENHTLFSTGWVQQQIMPHIVILLLGTATDCATHCNTTVRETILLSPTGWVQQQTVPHIVILLYEKTILFSRTGWVTQQQDCANHCKTTVREPYSYPRQSGLQQQTVPTIVLLTAREPLLYSPTGWGTATDCATHCNTTVREPYSYPRHGWVQQPTCAPHCTTTAKRTILLSPNRLGYSTRLCHTL